MLSNQQSINWFCSINKKRVNSKMHDLWIDFYLNKRASFNTIRMIFDNTNMHSLLHSSTSHHEIAAKSINIRTSWNRNICILIVSPSKFCLQIVILFFFKTGRHCKKCCNAWVCYSIYILLPNLITAHLSFCWLAVCLLSKWLYA